MAIPDIALSIVLGVVLAASTGFRVFLPMLIAGGAAYAGYLPLGESFSWLATPAALIMLGVAALVEIVAYYIPGLDNLLDTLAAPAALVAGTVLSAAVMTGPGLGAAARPGIDGPRPAGLGGPQQRPVRLARRR